MKDPCFNFYSDNFLSGTMFFTDEQTGKYIRLLCAQHQTGHLEEKHMIFICKGCDVDIWKKFTKDGNGLYFNERLEFEIEKRKAYSLSRSANKKGKVKEVSNQDDSKSYDNHMGIGIGIDNNIVTTEKEKTWKDDFNLYLADLRQAFKTIQTPEYVKERESYHPGLDIKKTIEKACKDFWATEEGWKNKKQKHTKAINWKRTFNNSLTENLNRVWKPKIENNNTPAVKKISYTVSLEGERIPVK